MCQRFANHFDVIDDARRYACDSTIPDFPKRFNIRPGERVAVIIQDQRGRRLGAIRWGWHRPHLKGRPWTTARAEKAPNTPEFGPAYRKHRCIVMMSAWYEWSGPAMCRQRWIFKMGRSFAVAGLWEMERVNGNVEEGAFVMLTMPAMPTFRKISERMPAIIPFESVDDWLIPTTTMAGLRQAVAPRIFQELEAYEADFCDTDTKAMLDPLPDPTSGSGNWSWADPRSLKERENKTDPL